MTVQLREPCTRSLRQLFSPWQTPLRYKPQPIHNLTFSWRAHSTCPPPVKVPSLPLLDAILSKPKVVKCKKRADRLWTKYQSTYNTRKETLDVQHYDVLITALLEKACHGKKTGFWARIIQAFEEARSINIEPSPTMYMAAIKAYGVSRDTANVTSIFKEYKKRYLLNPTTYGLYMTALLDCGQLPMAYRTFREMLYTHIPNSQLAKHLASFISLCVKRNNTALGLEALGTFRISELDAESIQEITQSLWLDYSTTEITPLSVQSCVQMYIEKSTSMDTLYLFTLIDLLCHQPFTPTHTTFQLLLQDQIKHRNHGRLISILSHMHRLQIPTHADTLDILSHAFGPHDTYTAFIQVIKTYTNSQSVTEAMIKRGDTTMDRLRDSHCVDLDCYATIMEHWLTLGLFHLCIREYERLKTDFTGTDTNRRIVKAVLTARFSTGQDWSLAAREVNKLQITFTSTTISRILANMISLETRTGQGIVPGQHVLTALQLMEKKLDLQLCAEDIGRLITGLGKRGDVETGFRIYTWVRELAGERCASSNMYKSMMTSATKNNDIRKLERVWVDMQYRKRYLGGCVLEKEQHTLTRYNMLLNGYASRLPKPDLTRAKKVFQRLLAQNLAPDIVTYNILIKAFVNANNMDAANQIFQKMVQSGIEPDTYSTNTILNGWIIRRDWHHVEDFVKELKSCTRHLDIVTFNLLVQSFLQLDSKTMNYTHLLKNQKKGSHLKQVQETSRQRSEKPMSREKIWSIFQSTTGYTSDFKPAEDNAFVKLFSIQADHVTCKLFMKAFVNIKDYPSAAKIQKWMYTYTK